MYEIDEWTIEKDRREDDLWLVYADIIAAKNLFDDKCRGIEMPLSFYDEQSDRMCGKPSRHIYD